MLSNVDEGWRVALEPRRSSRYRGPSTAAVKPYIGKVRQRFEDRPRYRGLEYEATIEWPDFFWEYHQNLREAKCR